MTRALTFDQPYASTRALAMGRAAVATSHVLATQAGMDMLARGGNAVDAIVAAAMTLTVVEPTGCGIGSDGFAILWDGKALHGLNSSGRSPAAWTADRFAGMKAMPKRGWNSVTVPGAVASWVALMERYGRLSLEEVAAPAIRYARHGFQVTPITAAVWRNSQAELQDQPGWAECFLPGGKVPAPGALFRSEGHATTLEEIAATKGQSFYSGRLAEAMEAHAKANGAVLTVADLAAHSADWIDTMSIGYEGARVHELPPNGQGIATLMGLGILDAAGAGQEGADDPETLHAEIEACKIALADLPRYAADPDFMEFAPETLLDPGYLAERAKLLDRNTAGDPGHGDPKPGGTVCLSAADEDGMMVSFIQSNYMGFGSGVVVPGTGISLQNRGFGFTLQDGHPNQVAPRKRPFHTIIPGFVTQGDQALMAFGLMGGPMQAQGHLQMMQRILRFGQNPQAAADAPRWRALSGRRIAVEEKMPAATMEALRAKGHELVVEKPDNSFGFGGAQIVMKTDHGYVAGSDPRKDGAAAAR